MHENRPQAPGYLANLMARLFRELSGAGLAPLGIRAEQFPVLVQLWFGDAPVTRASLVDALELDQEGVDLLVRGMADALLIENAPADKTAKLVLTQKANDARDAAVKAARAANQAATAALSETEISQFLALMNRVIDALQAAKT